MKPKKVFLASGSPRRKELLKYIFDEFEVKVPVYEEDEPQKDENAFDYVKRMAKGKAEAFASQFIDLLSDGDIFITADTVVSKDGKIFGKPTDRSDAKSTLTALSGKKHEVATAFTIGTFNSKNFDFKVCICVTDVFFRNLSERELETYLDSDEPWDKAGSYGIQGAASVFVEKINGNYHNVVGLPVSILKETLIELEII